MPSVSRIISVLRAEGARGLFRRAARQLRRKRVMVVFERSLEQPDRVPFLPSQPFVVRLGVEADLPLLEPRIVVERVELYRQRLSEGFHLGLVLRADESEVIGWFWCSDETFYEPYDNATYLAQSGDFLHFDGEVRSDARGRGWAFCAFPLIWRFWRRRRFVRALCAVDAENRPSLKLHRRLGYRPLGQFTVTSLLGQRMARSETPLVLPGNRADLSPSAG